MCYRSRNLQSLQRSKNLPLAEQLCRLRHEASRPRRIYAVLNAPQARQLFCACRRAWQCLSIVRQHYRRVMLKCAVPPVFDRAFQHGGFWADHLWSDKKRNLRRTSENVFNFALTKTSAESALILIFYRTAFHRQEILPRRQRVALWTAHVRLRRDTSWAAPTICLAWIRETAHRSLKIVGSCS